ncbi:unnamed protein product [Blepharisma stoltei]|uniref:TNFR-Cys domain-containing protein n=1 Tax=Blepharisma stoltei TaxID=1481888 RepID=A0AAU9KD38_9CILI|nr:unnamed protein product [Blepharisma stoltei]
MINTLLIDNKICANVCPTHFRKVCDSVQEDSCTGCSMPTSPALFELEFWKIEDLSATYIANKIDPTDKWANPLGTPYSLDTKTSPFPTRNRGFYFSSTSSMTSNQNYIPALYFTSNAWILPISTGQILTANLDSKNYIELIYNSDIFTFKILAKSAINIENQISVSSDIIDSNWQYISIQINQIDCDVVNITVSRNNIDRWTSKWGSTIANFADGAYTWTIGKSDSDSFFGFLYWIEATNSLNSNYWILDTTNLCSILNYFGQCMKCDNDSGCQNWLCSTGEDDCSRCYSLECSECYGYAENMCTGCKTGMLPYCCDWLANTCISTFNSTSCSEGTVLIDGVCLYAVPYGFINNSPVNTPVINADFTKSFAGIYDNIMITGESSSAYNYWNSPESIDPLPAKQRGLYFLPNSYLKATINLYRTFTIGAWIYPISGYYITYTENLKVHSDGTIEISMQNFLGDYTAYSASTSPSLNNWNYISYIIKYRDDGSSSITPYIDASAENSYIVQEGIFRPIAGASLYLGADFNGFISLFQLWQTVFTDFLSFRDYFNDDQGAFSLWSCDYGFYFDGNSCNKCLDSCQSGCVKADSCNLCATEFCLECSSFEPNSCNSCEQNRLGILCQCDIGYYQAAGQTACSQCYTGCSNCSGSLYYQCTSCISYYYYFVAAGSCLSDCPMGYTKSVSECLFESDIIFDLNLNTQSGIIYDSVSSIPVITGSSEQFYPNYEEDDPKSAYLRGFYFNGNSSILRLPEYKNYISPKLRIGPIFMISIWLNAENESCTIMSKNNISDNYSIVYAITLVNAMPILTFLIDNSIFIYSSKISLHNFEWNHLAFIVAVDTSGHSVATCYANTNQDTPYIAGFGYFQDINSDVVTLIGARQISQGIGDFFQGFLYEIRIYNKAYEIGLLSQTSCLENCRVCNITGTCIPNCNITESWEGPGYNNCLKCDSSCNNSCKDTKENCLVCNDSLCDICSDNSPNECISCKPNASLKNNSCVCNISYNGTTACTYVSFSVNLLVFSDDTLSLNFSDPLQYTLTLDDFIIWIENGPEITWSLEQINNTYYIIPTQIKDKIEKNTIVNVKFFDLSQIRSIYNGILDSSTISSTLNEYDPNSYSIVVAAITAKVTTTVESAVIGSVALSFFNPNPSSLWGLLNCLQILSYLSLSGIPFSEKISEYLSNLNSYNLFPNVFEYLIDEKEGSRAYDEARNFGYDTDLILLNQGDDFFIIVASIISLPFAIYFADCSYRLVGKRFLRIFKNYKYGFYIRFWIQCYLELGAAALVGLKMFKVNNWIQIANIIICFIVVSLFIVSPLAFLRFSYRNRFKIQTKEKEFNSLYDSFFYEFQTERGLLYSLYYFVYFLRRFIYATNLAFLSESPKMQISINIICSLLSIFYLLIYWPFEDKIIQISNLVSEIMIGLIMFITSFYLFDISPKMIYYTENCIIFISIIIIGTQLCTSIAIFVRTLHQILRYKLNLYGNAKLSIHPMEEIQETM